LAVQYTYGATPATPTRAQVRRWVCAAALQPLNVTVRFVTPREGRALNQQFRGKDYATNVLTFPYENGSGDIAVCESVVVKEARAQKKPVRDHFAHIVMHGVLHVQGFDHEADVDAAQMEAHERRILQRFRIADPYVER
jgi:probable rRNA maturation factor